MTCPECREAIQRMIDRRIDCEFPNEVLQHTGGCTDCKAFLDSNLLLHRSMQELPRVCPSADLVSALKSIPAREIAQVNIGWGPEIRLGLQLLLPLFLPYIAQVFSLTLAQHLLEVVILVLGMTILLLSALKPFILGKPEPRISLQEV